jgi:hypothetical protein
MVIFKVASMLVSLLDNNDEMSLNQRVQNVAMYVVSVVLRDFFVYKPFGNLKKELGIRPERSFEESFQNEEMMLVQADFAVDIPRPLPPSEYSLQFSYPAPSHLSRTI